MIFLARELSINEWVKLISPYVAVGLLVIILAVIIIVIFRITAINRRLGDQDFEILESIKKDEHEKLFFDFTVSNKAFSINYLNVVGFKKGNVVQILSETNVAIAPRTKYVSTFSMEQIENLTIKDVNKYRKIRLFVENELGLRQESKGKLINKYLKRTFKRNKRNERRRAKAERMETGNYNFGERLWLVIKLFFRPIYKFVLRSRQSTNLALKESEIRRVYKAEHDKLDKKLLIVNSQNIEQKIKEESYEENKTRETMLELLKQEKALELQKMKIEAYEKAFEDKKEQILAINTEKEFKKYIKENPIEFKNLESEVIVELFEEISKQIANERVSKKKRTSRKSKLKAKEEKPKIEERKEEIVSEEKPLESYTVVELKALAKERGIPRFSTMNKATLIEELKK